MYHKQTPTILLALFSGLAAVLFGLITAQQQPSIQRTSAQVFDTSLLNQPALQFTDVQGTEFFARAASRMRNIGIMQGYDDGSFGGGNTINRAELAVMFERLIDKKIAPLEEKMLTVYDELTISYCGNGIQEQNEECDDANTVDGDGCSAQCTKERADTSCGARKLNDTFTAADGCNTCICTSIGIVCTERACATETPTKKVEQEHSSAPQKTRNDTPRCGDGICHDLEKELPPNPRFFCPNDCDGTNIQTNFCEEKQDEFRALMDRYSECQSNSDCVPFKKFTCPYLGCGAINKTGVPIVTIKGNDTYDTCRREGIVNECRLCVGYGAICVNNRCELR